VHWMTEPTVLDHPSGRGVGFYWDVDGLGRRRGSAAYFCDSAKHGSIEVTCTTLFADTDGNILQNHEAPFVS